MRSLGLFVFPTMLMGLSLLFGCSFSLKIEDMDSSNIEDSVPTEITDPKQIPENGEDEVFLNLEVKPFYPLNGENWNDYVSHITDDLSKWIALTPYLSEHYSEWPQNDVACNKLNSNESCIHGGELRRIEIPSKSSCDKLSMLDNLNGFRWKCIEGSANIYFMSIGLNKGMGLADIVDESGNSFKKMKVFLKKNNTIIGESELSTWWKNTVIPLDSGNINSSGARMTLSTTGNIYVIKESVVSKGINILGEKISLVTLKSSTLNSDSLVTSVDCRPNTGGVQNCFIWIQQSSHFFWLEGNVNSSTVSAIHHDSATPAVNSKHIRFHNMNVLGTVLLQYFSFGHLSNFFVHDQSYGLYTNFSWYTRINDFKASNITSSQSLNVGNLASRIRIFNTQIVNHQGSTAISFNGDGILSWFKVFNSSGIGLSTAGSGTNVSNGMIVNSDSGFSESSTDGNYANISVYGSSTYGVRQLTGAGKSLSNFSLINNDQGYQSGAVNLINVYNLYAIGNSDYEISLTDSVDHAMFGNLVLGQSAVPCIYSGTLTNVGLIDPECNQTGISSFTKTAGVGHVNTFKGYGNDLKNQHGVSSVTGISFDSIIDWFNFDSFKKYWIPFVLSWGSVDSQGKCITSMNCGIFDFNFSQSSPLKNIHGNFVEKQECPQITKGSNYAENPLSGIKYLQGVSEYMFDGFGNDNGLCENNEICYFHPDPGANLDEVWQYSKSCEFNSDGGMINITIFYGSD